MATLCLCESAYAQVEYCDGADNDADGLADEGFPCVSGADEPCVAAQGVAGRHACSVACTWTTCQPTVEVCDGLDNDGDGLADEDFECALAAEGPCADGPGRRLCLSNCRFGPCVVDEVCNHLDDDSDGLADENLPYRTTVATVEERLPGGYFSEVDSMACANRSTLAVLKTSDGVNTLLFDSEGRRVGDTHVLCYRPDPNSQDLFGPPQWDADPTGGLVLNLDDHFLAACIGWADPGAYRNGDPPHLLVFRVGFDGTIEGPVTDIAPHAEAGRLLSPGAADLEVVAGGVVMVWADAVGPRLAGQIGAGATLRSLLLDVNGLAVDEVRTLDTQVMGDTRVAYRVRNDERGPVLFVEEPAADPVDGLAASFWKYRFNPLTGALSDRTETLPRVTRLEVLERFAGGWVALQQGDEVGIWEDDGRVRWPRTARKSTYDQPMGRPRGRALGDDFIFADYSWQVTRMGANGAKSSVNRSRPLEPDINLANWDAWAGNSCIAPDGTVATVAIYARHFAWREPETPQYIQYTAMGCE